MDGLETNWRWFGHVLRRDAGYIGRSMPKFELLGKRWLMQQRKIHIKGKHRNEP